MSGQQPALRDVTLRVAEGTCPVHGTPLGLADTQDGSTAGLCEACSRYWWYDPETDQIGSFAAAPPYPGEWMPGGSTP